MNIKKMLQDPMRRRQAAKYEAMIQEQTTSYHDWIVEKEKQERGQMELAGQELSVSCVTYESCGQEYDLSAQSAEITVFHAAAGTLTEDNIGLIRDFFANHPETQMIYGDEDEMLAENQGQRTRPWLKADWSPDTLISYFYFGNIFAVRTAVVKDIVWSKQDDWKQNLYDFCLRVADRAAAFSRDCSIIAHLDSVIFHNTASIKHWGMETEFGAIKEQAYIRRGWPLKPT